MELPPITYCICTYKRPWYAVMTIQQIIGLVGYGGPVRFHIADGGSPQEDIDYYKMLTKDYPTTISVTDNLSDMVNSCAHASGEIWVVALDDFMPQRRIDLIPGVLQSGWVSSGLLCGLCLHKFPFTWVFHLR